MASGKEIARGAEGVLTRERFLGSDAVVKDRVRKGYREPHLDKKLRTGRTRVEARLLHEAKKAGVNCPVVYSVSGSELIVSFIDGELLRGLLARKAAGAAKMLKLTGEELGKLHSVDVVHGDFTTANVMAAKELFVLLAVYLAPAAARTIWSAPLVAVMTSALAFSTLE